MLLASLILTALRVPDSVRISNLFWAENRNIAELLCLIREGHKGGQNYINAQMYANHIRTERTWQLTPLGRFFRKGVLP